MKEAIPNKRADRHAGLRVEPAPPALPGPPRARGAGLAFDFEWSNKTLFYGQYKRTESYFENSELASSGLPSAEELAILEPYRGRIPDEVFTTAFTPPKTDGIGQQPRQPAPRAASC